MRSMRINFLLFTWMVICAVAPSLTATAQDKEKPKPGTTIDSWRQALPAEAETPAPAEEMPGDASSSASGDETRKTLLALEQRLMESVKMRDADSLSLIVASDFTFANPRLAVRRSDRSGFMQHALGDMKLTSFEFDKTTVRVFGRTAIVSGLLNQRASVAGEDWSGTYLLTDVWISRDGVWRVVSRHESPLHQKK